jgi:cold-inducible RNA-binding protein
MNRKLYVGNLSFQATEEELKELFGAYGEVADVKIISDRYTGRSRGFAFVTMGSAEAAQAGLDALNGTPFQGRNLVIDIARAEPKDNGNGPRGNNSGFKRDRAPYRERSFAGE